MFPGCGSRNSVRDPHECVARITANRPVCGSAWTKGPVFGVIAGSVIAPVSCLPQRVCRLGIKLTLFDSYTKSVTD